MPLEGLLTCAEAVVRQAGGRPEWKGFTAVLLNNEIWRNAVSAVPYDRRLLLLPQCLRDAGGCKADMDELGLKCRQCGECVIGQMKGRAEKLGYAVLVAEGAPVVMSLLAGGGIDAVIGVGCLDVLEKSFPYMHSGLIPGVAIPLLRDGCSNTDVDADWVWEAIYSRTADTDNGIPALRRQVHRWFRRECVSGLLAKRKDPTAAMAVDWVARGGKRKRPLLVALAYQALAENGDVLPESVRRSAVAVECFHKASLVHDDIEDGHASRYGRKTIHTEHGVPIALNVGDFLIGEGYRLLAELDAATERKVELLAAAAQGHRNLCLGQGRELLFLSRDEPPKVGEVLEVFRQKTAPAFQVALKVGTVLAGADSGVTDVLNSYGDSLGTAYQVRDDIDDLRSGALFRDDLSLKASVLLALAWQRARGSKRTLIKQVWSGSLKAAEAGPGLERLFTELGVELSAEDVLQSCITDAAGALSPLKNTALKGLLETFLARTFRGAGYLVCCDEYRNRHA
jgi:geranylgeranyl pyrophosphate synthase